MNTSRGLLTPASCWSSVYGALTLQQQASKTPFLPASAKETETHGSNLRMPEAPKHVGNLHGKLTGCVGKKDPEKHRDGPRGARLPGHQRMEKGHGRLLWGQNTASTL